MLPSCLSLPLFRRYDNVKNFGISLVDKFYGVITGESHFFQDILPVPILLPLISVILSPGEVLLPGREVLSTVPMRALRTPYPPMMIEQ